MPDPPVSDITDVIVGAYQGPREFPDGDSLTWALVSWLQRIKKKKPQQQKAGKIPYVCTEALPVSSSQSPARFLFIYQTMTGQGDSHPAHLTSYMAQPAAAHLLIYSWSPSWVTRLLTSRVPVSIQPYPHPKVPGRASVSRLQLPTPGIAPKSHSRKFWNLP